MSMPGFHAEAAVRRSTFHYVSAFSAYRPFPQRLIAELGGRGGEGEPGCYPWARCVPDKFSPTGCMLIGQDAYCHPIGRPCSGCSCPLGLTNCTIGCTDLKTDADNCGACGHTCAVGQTCLNGTCGTCPPGSINCNGNCVNPENDQNNCGACNNTCTAGQTCQNGHCLCPDGLPLGTNSNCGSCGTMCSSGICCAGTCGVGCPNGSCCRGAGSVCCPDGVSCCSPPFTTCISVPFLGTRCI